MSQFSLVELLIFDLIMLTDVVREMGYQANMNRRLMVNSHGEQQEVEMTFCDEHGREWGVAGNSEEGYDLVAEAETDLTGNIEQQKQLSEMRNRLKQNYAAIKVEHEAESEGYKIVEKTVMPDRTIRLKLRRW